MFRLDGRVALVTGAGQNIGAGIAHTLAAQGAHVVVNDLVPERAERVVTDIANTGGSATSAPFDVTDLDEVLAAVRRIGAVDVLVNNAGLAGAQPLVPKPFLDTTPAEWDAAIDVNLRGVMHCCHAVVPGMCERGWGRVITISSAAGTSGVGIGVAAYSAGKGGGLAFTRSLALEVAASGVTANSVAVGLIETPDPERTAKLARGIPVGRAGRPQDVAAACVWLAAEESAWVTAQTIQVNGGAVPT